MKIRDLCVARTGTWSASGVFAHARLLGYSSRKSDALALIKATLGTGTKRSGRTPHSVPNSVPHSVPHSVPDPVPVGYLHSVPEVYGNSVPGGYLHSVPDSVPHSVPQSVPQPVPREKEKKQKKERVIYKKLDTSYLAKSANFGEFEADVARWLEYQAEKRGAQFTLKAAQIAISAIAKARAKHGDDWTAEALEKTIDKNADLGYFLALKKGAQFGSRGAREYTTSEPSQFGSRGIRGETKDAAQLAFAADLAERMAKR